MSKGLCDLINTVDKYVVDDPNNPGEYNSEHLLSIAFPKKDCDSDDQKLTSSFIALLTLLNDNKNENLEGDKLVEYAILWLSYKLNQKKENRTIIFNEFYTKDIEKNSCYNQKITDNSDNKINKDVIKNKIKSMDIDIKDISNFYDAFKSLCNMYNEIVADDDQCNKCLESAGELFEKYEKLKNDLNINKGSSYYQLLSSLSNDYKIFENKYSDKCNHGSPLVACPRNSVIKNTLITIAIIFVAASILLGVSYKYSLFGFRKRGQKQHLREKLKK
ncbi:PIR protein [Plasmodium yoelii]|uniref:PIR protein n=3 Tax=Plasmodium yoelii TaxID=5861 RepID=A0AAF0AY83_PLAYO|nr:PIR protein [Plasmodium yoelii]XP_034493334.1 PIR protein [Plasmodium yoelii]WBY54612.1 PIR protein [Plasmodium yoelii yoelii]WBY60521.1 PIR protein [Plasmodium yoelii yoelii]VTZ71606.1 PIR protein [Plasmodium yoelii]VTZ81298.1 PIR protein [Plasmodium yoelii]|eukprot:XP_022811087.1 PIR protein [Plasmodium yoelii]